MGNVGRPHLAATAHDRCPHPHPEHGELGIFLGRQIVAVGQFLDCRRIFQEILRDMGEAIGIGAKGQAQRLQRAQSRRHRLWNRAIGQNRRHRIARHHRRQTRDRLARAQLRPVMIIDRDRQPDWPPRGLRPFGHGFCHRQRGHGLAQDHVHMRPQNPRHLGIFRRSHLDRFGQIGAIGGL